MALSRKHYEELAKILGENNASTDCPSTATQDHKTIRRQQRARTPRKWF
jgi:hypothetical protein